MPSKWITESELPLVASDSTAGVYVESDVCLSWANPCKYSWQKGKDTCLDLSSLHVSTHKTHPSPPVLPHAMHISVSISSKGSLPPLLPPSALPDMTIYHHGLLVVLVTNTLQKEEGQRKRWKPSCTGVLGNDRYTPYCTLHQNRTHCENRSNIKCAMAL